MINKSKSIRPLLACLFFWGAAVCIGCQAWRILDNPVPGLVETSSGVWQRGRKPDAGWRVVAGAAGLHFLLGIWSLKDFIKSRGKTRVPAADGPAGGGENSAVSLV